MAIDIFRALTKLEASRLLADEMRATLGWHDDLEIQS
jgi:hypothetical protein